MRDLLWLVPALPLLGFVALVLANGRWPRRMVSIVAVGSVALSTVAAVIVSVAHLQQAPNGGVYSQTLWQWMRIGDFAPTITFTLDALSMTMMLVITTVSLLIHVYSTEFMAPEEGYSRFFAYMNLFVGSMLILILADNLLLLYLGWEGVGLCSYLLIGFWYQDRANARAAVKAFLVTRIGDTALAVGIFLLFVSFHTMRIQPILQGISSVPSGSPLCSWAAALLLAGAVAKSAQLPLQTWLPDAMAGPTPVSALIHAATMVTAGVYLIARMQAVFVQSPIVLSIVAIIGTATLLLAGFSALTQYDIKRVLAYSTMSQIGYMFLALGVAAWPAAIYHFLTHAFFKSSLFLAAGVVIKALGGEHDIFKMGGLRRHLPVTFRAFLLASLVLAAVPIPTLTFNSKDFILNEVWLSGPTGVTLWTLALFGSFLTAAYTFRLLLIVFSGPERMKLEITPSGRMTIPCIILAAVAILAGVPELLNSVFGWQGFYAYLASAMPSPTRAFSYGSTVWVFQLVYVVVSVAGIALAYLFNGGRSVSAPILGPLHRLWQEGWGFDWLYARLIVRPYIRLAALDRNDFVDLVYAAIARISREINRLLSWTVNGNVRWYAAGIAGGAAIIMGLVVILWY
jgi:NADH-quinone oxidoreductase subunit L